LSRLLPPALALLAAVASAGVLVKGRGKEVEAGATLALPGGGEVSLSYWTRGYVPETVTRMRADASVRESVNLKLVTLLGIELRTSRPLRAGGRTIEPGSHRLGLTMNEGGAFSLSLLKERELLSLPQRLHSDQPNEPYLGMRLGMREAALFHLVWYFGTDRGEVAFYPAG